MRLDTPRSKQGQTVECEYGWHRGEYYMRSYDRSDREEKWYRADSGSRDALIASSYDAGGANFPPKVEQWIPCGDPQVDHAEEDQP